MISLPLLFKSMKKYVGKNSCQIEDFSNSIHGFVDVKGYKGDKLVYHDFGDNIVTDWMRHAIMVLLTGDTFTRNGFQTFVDGSTLPTADSSRIATKQVTMPSNTQPYHRVRTNDIEAINLDGYIINRGQYFWEDTPDNTGGKVLYKYSSPSSELSVSNRYAMFPTKVLLGTGKEYDSWDTLKSENETENAAWYDTILNLYGGGGSNETGARQRFDPNISGLGCNFYSGSLAQTVYSGNSVLMRCRTVNDPNANSILSTNATASREYGIAGAIKSPYFTTGEQTTYLETNTSADGKLLKPEYRGVGRPCFIYFQYDKAGNNNGERWDNPGDIDVTLSKELNKNYLHRITFSVQMSSQDGSSDATGAFFPYNGYTLKQVGLFNDSLLTERVTADSSATTYPYMNMPCGMLLAKKNITPFLKTADLRMSMTWMLSI